MALTLRDRRVRPRQGATLRTCVVIAAGLLVATLAVSAQRPAAGTGSLSGVVVTTATSPAPVRRAIVKLSAAGEVNRSAITDDRGRFAFSGLPAGLFMLTVSKPAHLTTVYGAKDHGKPGTPVSLAAGQSIADLRIAIARGAAISGTVRDPNGEPAPDVQVAAAPARLTLAPVGDTSAEVDTIRTDDRGVFRLFGLAPGEYVVAATPSFLGSGEASRMSREEIDAELRALQLRARGSGVPISAPPAVPAIRRYNFASVFHPATTVPSQATRITLKEGEERHDVDIALVLVPMATIEGVVLGPTGDPSSAVALTISQGGPPMPYSFGMTPSLATRPGADGVFRYTSVAPGTYTISARSTIQTTTTRTTNTGSVITQRGPDLPAGQVLWASMEITVAGDGISGLTLRLRPAATVSGRVTFDRLTGEPPANLAQIRILIAPAVGRLPDRLALTTTFFYPGLVTTAANARADGGFAVTGVTPGAYALTAFVPGAAGPDGWWLRSAIADGRDLLEGPLEIGENDLAGVVITLSDRHTELSGRLVTSGGGQPAPDHVVVVFPDDRSLWRAARRIRSTRPATDGRFSFADLPPGTYLIAALTHLDENGWQNADFLAQVAPAGVKVTIGDGEKKVQDLRVVGRTP